MPAQMTTEEIHSFLDSRPGWIALTTLGRDGFPHTIPIGYFRSGTDVYMGCRTGTQKLKNIERSPSVSLLLESGSTMEDIKGVCIQGHASVITDPAELLRLMREAGRQRGMSEAQMPAQARPGAAYIRVQPVKYISWDYAKSE